MCLKTLFCTAIGTNADSYAFICWSFVIFVTQISSISLINHNFSGPVCIWKIHLHCTGERWASWRYLLHNISKLFPVTSSFSVSYRSTSLSSSISSKFSCQSSEHTKWDTQTISSGECEYDVVFLLICIFFSLLSLCFLSFVSPFLRPRLAKSTLTLIPLLGIHNVVFIFATDESTSGSIGLRLTRLFSDLFFSSFQVDCQSWTLKHVYFFTTLFLVWFSIINHLKESGVPQDSELGHLWFQWKLLLKLYVV